MTEDEKKKVCKVDSFLGELLEILDKGNVYLEDLDSDQIKKLKKLLKNKE